VEGAAYAMEQGRLGFFGFEAFLAEFRRVQQEEPERVARQDWADWIHTGPERWNPALYGHYGNNRYLVRAHDGALFIHRRMMRDGAAALTAARAAGFLVYPDDLPPPTLKTHQEELASALHAQEVFYETVRTLRSEENK
jgi:hypothetical protein